MQTTAMKLTWRRFSKLTAARDAFRKEPCVYLCRRDPPDLSVAVEHELIWRRRNVLTYNTIGKLRPPRLRIELINEGDAPDCGRFEA